MKLLRPAHDYVVLQHEEAGNAFFLSPVMKSWLPNFSLSILFP